MAVRETEFIPVPDPTKLTTELVDRAINAERDRTDGQFAVRDERLNGMDSATQLRLAQMHSIKEEIEMSRGETKILATHERELTTQRFDAVGDTFTALNQRTAEQKADTRAAVDAALQAAKELVALQTEASDKSTAKSEASFAKQIDALGLLLQKSSETTDDKIIDLKSRMDRIEGNKIGGVESKASVYAAVALIITLLIAAVTIIGFILANGPA